METQETYNNPNKITKRKPRGSPPKQNATSGMFSVRTKPAEQRAIIKYARDTLKVSANEFILQAVRAKMPAIWIEQGEGRPLICSKCGEQHHDASAVSQHQVICWNLPRAILQP